jgi:5-methylcytosine-specific restriction endonuclease McrA
MALAPARPCTHPKCARLVLAGSECPDHPRPSAQARGYTSQWATYARSWLIKYPWCGQRGDGLAHREHSRCVQRGLKTRAQVVDHIVSIARGGAVMDPRNHQSLCRSCNVTKG